MNNVRRKLVWPAQVLANIIAMQPNTLEGDERPLGIRSTIVRVLAKENTLI